MRILFIDDEPEKISDYCDYLRKLSHEVKVVNRIGRALTLLQQSFVSDQPYDFVVIDLMLPGELIPYELEVVYKQLESCFHNEGQAIGQWLWERRKSNLPCPYYCYFSSVPTMYSRHNNVIVQEFFDFENAMKNLVLEKGDIPRTDLLNRLNLVIAAWDNLS